MNLVRIGGSVLFLSTVCLSITLSQSTPAENTRAQVIQVVSAFVPPGHPVPNQCRQEYAVLASTLGSLPRPTAWRWVVLCDEAAWGRFLRLTGRPEEPGIYASTDFLIRTTYLRGPTLLRPDDPKATPAHVIAHELAHIVLNTPNEARAEAQCRQWLDGLDRQLAALAPPSRRP